MFLSKGWRLSWHLGWRLGRHFSKNIEKLIFWGKKVPYGVTIMPQNIIKGKTLYKILDPKKLLNKGQEWIREK